MAERDIQSTVQEFQTKIGKLRDEIGHMIVGQKAIIDGVILCLLVHRLSRFMLQK